MRVVRDGIDMTTYGDAARPSPLEELSDWLEEVELVTGSRPTKLRIPPGIWQEIKCDPEVANWYATDVNAWGKVAAVLGLKEVELINPGWRRL